MLLISRCGAAGYYHVCCRNNTNTVATRQKMKIARRWWVRPAYRPEQSLAQGKHVNLIKLLRAADIKKFTNWMCMTPATFDKLLTIVPLNSRSKCAYIPQSILSQDLQ